MEVFQGLVTLFSAYAWPVGVFGVALLFRKQLREMVGRIHHVEAPGGFKFDAERSLAKASRAVAEIEANQVEDPIEAQAATSMLTVRQNSKGNTEQLIRDAWFLVVDTMNETIGSRDPSWTYEPPGAAAVLVLRTLASSGTIPRQWLSSLDWLWSFHEYADVVDYPTASQAEVFASMCQQLITDLLRARDERRPWLVEATDSDRDTPPDQTPSG